MKSVFATLILDKGTCWIQWTMKQPGTAVLWAYDPVDKKAVEILQVREK